MQGVCNLFILIMWCYTIYTFCLYSFKLVSYLTHIYSILRLGYLVYLFITNLIILNSLITFFCLTPLSVIGLFRVHIIRIVAYEYRGTYCSLIRNSSTWGTLSRCGVLIFLLLGNVVVRSHGRKPPKKRTKHSPERLETFFTTRGWCAYAWGKRREERSAFSHVPMHVPSKHYRSSMFLE